MLQTLGLARFGDTISVMRFQRWHISKTFDNGYFCDTNLSMDVSVTPYRHTCQELCVTNFFRCSNFAMTRSYSVQKNSQENKAWKSLIYSTYLRPFYFHPRQGIMP